MLQQIGSKTWLIKWLANSDWWLQHVIEKRGIEKMKKWLQKIIEKMIEKKKKHGIENLGEKKKLEQNDWKRGWQTSTV